jgi:Ras family protein T1
MTDTVRIVVCGDEGTGKSSLITCLVKDHFRPTKIQPTLPPLTIGAPEGVLTTIVDTSGKCGGRRGRGMESGN